MTFHMKPRPVVAQFDGETLQQIGIYLIAAGATLLCVAAVAFGYGLLS